MKDFPWLHSSGSNSIDKQVMAEELDGVLEGINKLIAATHPAQSSVSDELGRPLQQISDFQHTQLIQILSIFGSKMELECPNSSSDLQTAERGDAAKFAAESSRSMIEKLVQLHELSAKHARSVVKIAQTQKHNETAALMNECITFHVKSAWMLRALL